MSGLRERVAELADEWERIDREKPYAMVHIADCADALRDELAEDETPGDST